MKTVYFLFLFITFQLFVQAQNDQGLDVKNHLIAQLDNEKLAFKFYHAMYDRWNILALKNLAKCEERHIKVVEKLICEFNDQQSPMNLGEENFNNQKYNAIYHDLISRGTKSENEALIAAGSFEESFIVNIEYLSNHSDTQVQKDCLDNLLESTIEHLNLLVCHLKHRNIEYKPSVLSVAKYIHCIGDQYADFSQASHGCSLRDPPGKCP